MGSTPVMILQNSWYNQVVMHDIQKKFNFHLKNDKQVTIAPL